MQFWNPEILMEKRGKPTQISIHTYHFQTSYKYI